MQTRFTLSSLRTIRIVNISGRGRIPAFSVALDRQKACWHPLGLWQEDGLPTSSIGDKLQELGGTLTGAIDRMEETGLVRRERDTGDRRIWRIWLTDSGPEVQDVLPPLVAEIGDRAVEGFSEADRELFSQLIDRAIVNLS
ncbi:MarR family transcriptional regulator [Microcoleus sp. B3-A4]|uniref:MarR family transcriptional regulator n=1 Tax=Microcoleus sp. B3-A4 TaxID=2818653 RepID=UPI002FD089C7